MTITATDRIVRSDEPVWSPVGDELVMMSVENGKYYGMNDIAATIWERLEAPVTAGCLCEDLLRSFDVGRDECEKDVLNFLELLRKKGLIVRVEETSR